MVCHLLPFAKVGQICVTPYVQMYVHTKMHPQLSDNLHKQISNTSVGMDPPLLIQETCMFPRAVIHITKHVSLFVQHSFVYIYIISSAESQNGINAVQRCSIEKKGTISIDFVQL